MPPIPHRPLFRETPAPYEQTGGRIPAPARFEGPELLGQRQPELGAGDDGVDTLDRFEQLGSEHRGSVKLNGLRKRGQTVARNREASRRAVAAVSLELVGGRVHCPQQVEPRDAPSRASAPRFAVQRNQDRRAVMALDDPRGNDPDHTRVPPFAPQDVRAALALLRDLGLGIPGGALLHSPTLRVHGIQLGGDLASSATIVGQQQLAASGRWR